MSACFVGGCVGLRPLFTAKTSCCGIRRGRGLGRVRGEDRGGKAVERCKIRMGVALPPSEFEENISKLPSVEGLEKIELFAFGRLGIRKESYDGIIRNQPGSKGSMKVYYALLRKHKGIDPNVAEEGLNIFAEMKTDAEENPGKHPNIDRLKAVIDNDLFLLAKVDGHYLVV